MVQRTTLLRWLLRRLKPREFDSNKESAGSLLALLLQTHPPNAQALADINGIDALLQVHPPRCFSTDSMESVCLGRVGLWPTPTASPYSQDAFHTLVLKPLLVQRGSVTI